MSEQKKVYRLNEYKLYKSKWKAIRLLLLSSIFVIPSFWFIVNSPDPELIEWLVFLFFGLGYPVGFFQLLDRRPHIIINEVGIYDRTVGREIINWEIISDAYIVSVRSEKFICLVIDEKFNAFKSRSKAFLRTARWSKSMGFQELNLNVGFTNVDAEKMLEFILAMRGTKFQEREIMIKKAISEKI